MYDPEHCLPGYGWGGRTRTSNFQYQKLTLYQLNYAPPEVVSFRPPEKGFGEDARSIVRASRFCNRGIADEVDRPASVQRQALAQLCPARLGKGQRLIEKVDTMTPIDPVSPPRRTLVKAQSGWKSFFITVAGVVTGMLVVLPIALFVIFAAIGAAVNAFTGQFASEENATGSILSIDLRTPMTDHSTGESLFGTAPPSVVETVRAIRHAETDDDIKGIFVRAGFGMAPASAEEIAVALDDFKESGKFVVGFAQGFESPSLTGYAAMAPAEIWMQDTTSFAVAGMGTESEYLKGTFDKIGADPEFVQFHEYKSAADTYDETGMTEPVREATEAWLGSVYTELVGNVAEQRDMEASAVEAVLARAPITAEDAKDAGMVDTLGFLEEAKAHARELAGDEDAEFVNIASYKADMGDFGDPVIAVIGGQGAIVPGTGGMGPNPFNPTPLFGSDTVAAAFDEAIKNDKVKAIVFRVSSGGGSAAASDQIDAAVLRAKAKDIPVVVSMGQYAASGGYYVSANADHIVAQPTTITGSIGVLGGKVALEGAFDKIGYNIDAVKIGGPYVGAYSVNTPFTPEQEAGFTRQMSEIYEDFTSMVAEGRDMPIDDVKEVAKGRVWTGRQALELGLVDEMGGFETALNRAKLLAGLDADDGVRLRRFPKPATFEEQLSSFLQVSAEASADLATIRALARSEEVQAILRAREAAQPHVELDARLPRFQD